MTDHPDKRHFSDPEILPPERGESRRARARLFIDERDTRRIYVTKVGPFGLLAFWLLGGVVTVAVLLLFLGAFVIVAPLVGVLLAVGAITGLLHVLFRRSP